MEFQRVFITGDKHGNFFNTDFDLVTFCNRAETTKDDLLIILGDVGLNYYVADNPDYKNEKGCKYINTKSSKRLKKKIEDLPITLLCIHGNHEARPSTIKGYETKQWSDAMVYFENEFPSILFSQDGSLYNINDKKCLTIGGAYSVDKYYRLARSKAGFKEYKWFEDEQPTEDVKTCILKNMDGKTVDNIFTHTCPKNLIPHEAFLPGINQDTVDVSTEEFLQQLEEKVIYKNWYCGHYHIDIKNYHESKLTFLFNDIIEM
ncbi:metallophosphoesterase [[Clostridium] innocuum]|uniref:metallophosphoesterase n=1 Tax=Clostridium innocuum TaxID=1522 RepID=UPI000D6B80F6|nr:metallophosphoesterase [[Clostridium] innocuum]MCR0316615.1 metallophosphoesterase [[Clostridium] innocuum]MCR0371904.1 metallophosphoesterase [[Clostridium] innocuum]MCR0376014.1 metallophosphoesterase [[Clostridium] innocuum]MCR0561265.1 metallophosphoesterase [[Clostridium] innocuum]MCR0604529.1 metallophosphoesterase [[Clostridium] innocuum]